MELGNKKTDKKQRKSTSKMDCGPKYSKVSESLRAATSGSVQCSMFCGGRQCKYEGQARWRDSDMAIKGLYSSWATNNILAMARPSTRTIKKYNVIQQFQRWGITAVINLQHPGEHANCGFGLEKSGFTYNPEDFMDNRIFFYNFIWQDYGVRSLESILDIVKVMDFALQNGKVAVHCHAGLGRTGVLIACYLIYSSRITPEQAIHIVRIRRPRSVQTRGQISCVQDFAKFLKPLWVIFPTSCSLEAKRFTLQRYLVRQKHILHGYEARELKFIPKIIFIPCKRILELCGADTDKLGLTNNRLVGKPDDEIDSTDGEDELQIESSLKNSNESTCDISASLEDLKGELDPENISSNDECDSSDLSNSESSGCMSFQTESSRRKSDSVLCGERKSNIENKLELLQKGVRPNDENVNSEISKLNEQLNDNNFNAVEGSSTSSRNIVNKCTSVDDVAAAFSTNIEADGDLVEKVKKLQRILNESKEGWKIVEEETNPCALITLMVSWIDCLMEPVLSSVDVETLVENKENPQEGLLKLTKSQRGITECLLVTIFKLNPVDKDLREKAFLRILSILTKNEKGVANANGTETGTNRLSSSLTAETLKFCILLYENWSKS